MGEAKKSQAESLLGDWSKTYRNALHRSFLRRGVQHSTAEDLTQSVFVKLAKRAQLEDIENPAGYIHKVAAHVWADHCRGLSRRQHHQHTTLEEFHLIDEVFSPERVYEGKRELERLMNVLNQLPERTRQVYLLCRVEGWKRKDVSKRLRISISAIDKHLIKATAKVGLAMSRNTAKTPSSAADEHDNGGDA